MQNILFRYVRVILLERNTPPIHVLVIFKEKWFQLNRGNGTYDKIDN